jgi:hypothetical protein
MTSQTQSNIKVTLLLLLLFCPVSEVAPSRAENNKQLGNTFFITSMYLAFLPYFKSVNSVALGQK